MEDSIIISLDKYNRLIKTSEIYEQKDEYNLYGLKPCPFCHSKNVHLDVRPYYFAYYFEEGDAGFPKASIKCENCGISVIVGSLSTQSTMLERLTGADIERFKDRWNNRS